MRMRGRKGLISLINDSQVFSEMIRIGNALNRYILPVI